MAADPVGPASAPSLGRPPGPGAPVRVRPGRLADVGPLVRLYLGQREEDRRHYHPFPFSRWVLRGLFTYLVLERPFARFLLRRIPRASMVLLVAEWDDAPEPVGYGTLRFTPDGPGGVRSVYGSLVADPARGLGVGGALMRGAMEVARAHGVRVFTTTFLGSNRVSESFLRAWGFTIRPTTEDRHRRGEANYLAEIDLESPRSRRPSATGPVPVPAEGGAPPFPSARTPAP